MIDSHAATRRDAPSLSVIICAYTLDRWEDLKRSIRSVLSQGQRVDELIVVADHNNALHARVADTFPGVVVVANTEKQGLSGARNTGVRAARCDVVAFLDDDAYASPDWAGTLLEAYVDNDVLGVGGGVLPEWRAQRPEWFPDEFLWVVGCSYLGQPTELAEVRNAIGANMSFRRSVLIGVGGFDTRVGRVGTNAAGCEETDLSIRARTANPSGRILLQPAAVCHHVVTQDRVAKAYFRARCRAEGASKALMAASRGSATALSSERSYVVRVLTVGWLREMGAALRGDRAALRRSVMLVEGVLLTACAYLQARRQRA